MKRKFLTLIITILILTNCMAEENGDSSSAGTKAEKVVLEELKTRAEDDKASIDSIVGLWVSISADNYGDFTIEGVDKNQFIKIEQDGSAHMEIENIITDGQLKEDEYGWEFHSDYGTFFLFQVESLDSFKNGCFELSIDDIIYAYFKNIEEFE